MAKLFDEAIKTLAKVYSGDMTTDLQVLYDGPPAYDVEKHIMHLPYQIGEDVPKNVENEFRVFLGHESYERRWRKLTPAMRKACEDSQCLKMWFNCTGDVSLEEEMAEEFPGLGLLAGQKNAEIGESIINAISTKDLDPTHAGVGAITTLIGGGAIEEGEALARLPQRWGPYVKAGAKVMRSRKGTSIQEAFDLAVQAREACDLVWEDEEEPPCGPGGDEEGGDEVEDENEGEGRGEGLDEGQGESLLDKQRREELEEALENMVNKKTGTNGRSPWNSAGQIQVYTFSSDYDVIAESRETHDWRYGGSPSVLDINAHSQLFQTKMRQALTVPVPKTLRRQLKGQLDERQIHQLCIGRREVFKKKLPQPDLSVAAVLSMDLSGSTEWAIPVLRHVSGVWNDAFGNLDIPLAIQGWCTGCDNLKLKTNCGEVLGSSERDLRLQPQSSLYRRESITFSSAKTFRQGYKDADVLENISKISAGGGTPTGEGLLWAVQTLINRPERRKLLFMFTDGHPGYYAYGPQAVHHNFIKKIASIAVANGIEIYPIGLGYDVRQIFGSVPLPASAKVSRTEDLLPVLDGWVVKAFRDMMNTSAAHRGV